MADNVLKALLENELLTEDVKKSIADAFSVIVEEQKVAAEKKALEDAAVALSEAIAERREELEVEVRTELAAKFLSEREELIKSLDSKVTEMLNSEINELKESIDQFRDLEIEYAAKLEDEKTKLAEQFSQEKKIFIAKIDEFVEARLSEEIQELREDINVIKQNSFGREVFETFMSVFEDTFVDKDEHFASISKKLSVMEGEKAAAEKRVQELQEELSIKDRSLALESTLAPLTGKRRAVMESVLVGYPTDKFGEVYKKMFPRVMETVKEGDVKPAPVTESVTVTETPVVDVTVNTVIETGDVELEESVTTNDVELNKEFSFLRRAAGIK